MTKRRGIPWGPSNPLWKWQHRKANKSKTRHISPVRHMTKLYRIKSLSKHRRRPSFLSTNSLFKYIRVGALAAPAISDVLTYKGDLHQMGNHLVWHYTGYNMDAAAFQWDGLIQGWTPFLTTMLITKGIQKISGMISRI